MQGLNAHGGVVVTLRDLDIAARPHVAFVLVVRVAFRIGPRRVENAARQLEIVVVGRVFAGVHLFAHIPTVEVLFSHFTGGSDALVLDTGLLRQGGMHVHVVDERQRVTAACMGEIEVDPFVLHQSHHEIEIGFLILNAIVPASISSRQLFIHRKTIRCEHFFDDLRHCFELKNLAVATAAGNPEPRAQLGGVDVVLAFPRSAGKSRADAIEMAHAHGAGFDLQRNVFAEHGFGAQGSFFAMKGHVIFEQLRDCLGARHLTKPERFTERGNTVYQSFHCHHPLSYSQYP